ncbi:MAG: type II toxin-antitoxin system VapC family toxin [Propionibacteriales bacterium]|nr:type II toxin-antitoxin system VapC family toxin [Propionibacteriales bacterium]
MATSADLLLDTSAAVPFLVAGHLHHGTTFGALSGKNLGLAGHAAFETFSVLTRLPEPRRLSPARAAQLIRHNFPHTKHLSAARAARLTTRFAEAGVGGGAVYDGLVAACALEHGCVLATRDERALATYTALGVEILLLT